MGNELLPFDVPAGMLESLRAAFPAEMNNDLSAGVSDSFGILSFKGKVWRVNYQGEKKPILDKTGNPTPFLLAVILKSSPQVSKIYYPGSYTEGDTDAPSCFSIDGVKPDPSSENIQSPSCAACPKAVWGSKITEQGNKTKACSDSRRMAVVPYPDLRNESAGGPLLLRVPPASLQEIKKYSALVDSWGVGYAGFITKISFDIDAAYPRLVFEAVGSLQKKDEITVVQEMIAGDIIDRMLAQAPIAEAGEHDVEVTPQETGPGPGPAEPEPVKEKAKPALEVVSTPEEQEEVPEKVTPKEANSVEPQPLEAGLNSLLESLL